MTSSAKQTKSKGSKGGQKKKGAKGKVPEAKVESEKASDNLPAYATAEGWGAFLSKNPTLIIGGTLLLTGWVFALHINQWRFTVPVVALWLGWLGVLGTVRFLWGAGVAIASEIDGEHEAFDDIDDERLKELLDEKRSLLRAIKEIEFDRDLGKMSEQDAHEIMKVYRIRAIAVIKKLDGIEDADLTVAQRIERELKARLDLEQKTKPKKRKAAPVNEKAAKDEEDAEKADADAEAASDEDKKDEVEVSPAAMQSDSSDEASVMDDAS